MNQILKIILCIIGSLIVLALIGYLGYRIGLSKVNTTETSSTPSATATQSIAKYSSRTATVTSTKTSQQSPTISDKEMIMQALADKNNRNIDEISIVIDKQDENNATGSVSFGDEPSGGRFVAVKQADNWKIIVDGNGIIECAILDEYSVPASIVNECYDTATGESVTR